MANYTKYNEVNRFPNLDSVEAKLISHLLNSQSKPAQILWKLLKYDTMDALSHENLSYEERKSLIFEENGESTGKRVFYAPFIDDAWQEQCSSLYIYVEGVHPYDQGRSVVVVNVETVVHSKISMINGDCDPDYFKQYEKVNQNDTGLDKEGNNVVAFKNRETVLLKCVLSEFNGLYLDGIGYLQFNTKICSKCASQSSLWNNRAYWGHRTSFAMDMSGISIDPNFSW